MKEKGLVIDKENPVLAASVDGEVTDPIPIPIKVKGTGG